MSVMASQRTPAICNYALCSKSTRIVAFRRCNCGVPRRSQHRQLSGLRVQAVLTAESAELDVSKMAPLGDRLLVKPKEQESVSAGGVLLSTSSKPSMSDALIGTVVAVGEECDLGLEKGDTVLFSKYSSSDLETASGEVCFVAKRSILAKLS